MKARIAIIVVLALIKLMIQLMGNRHYGFHRDELLHLSVSEHLAWGFMEFPPFIGFLGKLSYVLFDHSLEGTRLLSTMAGVAILILTCQMAKDLNGDKFATLLAGVTVLAFLPFYRNHTLFQPVAFDQLFWTLGFYYVLKYFNTENKNYLLLTGLTLGVGLMNKYTMLIWGFGVCLGLVFYNKGRLFKEKWVYISGLLSLLVFLPNIIWQFQNNLPIIRHLEGLRESQLDELGPFAFGLDQLNYPGVLAISMLGVVFLMKQQKYRGLGVAALVIFFTMWILQAKSYYVFALYPIMMAAGATAVVNYFRDKKKSWIYLIVAALLASTMPSIPHATPLLSIDDYVAFSELKEEDGRIELTGDYADMFGWEEQVKLVDSVYQSLNDAVQKNCVIWAENYGEAGALKILGKQYDLPNPISRHGSFWSWGYGNPDAQVWISLGNERASVEYIFEETTLVRMIYHKYAVGEENAIPIYLCRKPRQPIPDWWQAYEEYIFN